MAESKAEPKSSDLLQTAAPNISPSNSMLTTHPDAAGGPEWEIASSRGRIVYPDGTEIFTSIKRRDSSLNICTGQLVDLNGCAANVQPSVVLGGIRDAQRHYFIYLLDGESYKKVPIKEIASTPTSPPTTEQSAAYLVALQQWQADIRGKYEPPPPKPAAPSAAPDSAPPRRSRRKPEASHTAPNEP